LIILYYITVVSYCLKCSAELKPSFIQGFAVDRLKLLWTARLCCRSNAFSEVAIRVSKEMIDQVSFFVVFYYRFCDFISSSIHKPSFWFDSEIKNANSSSRSYRMYPMDFPLHIIFIF